ncbi:MAG: hypothetical protein GYB64_05220 [Chloroflexi bacterium]|nr:hypothetical protein [Chloroflexota bacterium]
MKTLLPLLLTLVLIAGCAATEPLEESPAGDPHADLFSDAHLPEAGLPEGHPDPGEVAAPPDLPETGAVRGAVMHATDAANLPAGTEVELHGISFANGEHLVEFLNTTTTTDANGHYAFNEIPLDMPMSAYVVRVMYDGVEFVNLAMVGSQAVLEVPVMVYENTTDDSVIEVESIYMMFEETDAGYTVLQAMTFTNTSDKVYMAADPLDETIPASVRIALPENAQNISIQGDELNSRYVTQGTIIHDTHPVFPGYASHEVMVQYTLPKGRVVLPVDYLTHEVTVLAPEDDIVRSKALSRSPIQPTLQPYQAFSASQTAAGSALAFAVRGPVPWLAALPVIVVGGLAIGYIGVRRRIDLPG